ncbi:MAG TPA: carboxypeptidase-like regulatory domain-containing protein [Pyrinomonadaceae bacterium]
MSKITGTVLDANQARVTDATIKIENARFSLKLQSNDEGKFEAELPAGTYRIIVRKDGFRRFELSPFRARANSSEQVSIRLEVEPPQTPLKVE